MEAVGISCDHLVKLYQFLDDFVQAGGGCQRRNRLFGRKAAKFRP
jgi:hypothetical protein